MSLSKFFYSKSRKERQSYADGTFRRSKIHVETHKSRNAVENTSSDRERRREKRGDECMVAREL